MEDNIPDQLNKYREENNLSQAELGDIIGTTFESIYRWENKRSKPSRIFLRIMKEKGIIK